MTLPDYMKLFRTVGRLAFVFVAAAAARAHDYWFETVPAAPRVGESVAVHLWVGHHMVTEQERKLQLAKTPSFRLHTTGATSDLLAGAKDDALPAARFTAAQAGGYLVAMERNASFIELEAKKFESYLKDEGLERIVVDREKRDETEKPGRERYARCLKIYVPMGAMPAGDDTYRKVVGHLLEIVPQRDPATLRPGERLPVAVTFAGKPLADATIALLNRSGALTGAQRAKTDAAGRAEFVVWERGLWVVRMVHMIRAPAGDKQADWESTWGAYSFVLP